MGYTQSWDSRHRAKKALGVAKAAFRVMLGEITYVAFVWRDSCTEDSRISCLATGIKRDNLLMYEISDYSPRVGVIFRAAASPESSSKDSSDSVRLFNKLIKSGMPVWMYCGDVKEETLVDSDICIAAWRKEIFSYSQSHRSNSMIHTAQRHIFPYGRRVAMGSQSSDEE